MKRSEVNEGDKVYVRPRGGKVIYEVKITHKGHIRCRIEYSDGTVRGIDYSSLHRTREELE